MRGNEDPTQAKKCITEKKNSVEGFKGRIELPEERIGKPEEDRTIGITESEEHKEKRWKKSKQS